MATMADVARLAQVSKTTVSHVLNGTRSVHPQTEQAVREAMEMLAYTPNTIARSLARSTTNSIGVAISAISNFYFGEIVQAVEAECTALGFTMLLADTHDDADHEFRMVKALHERRVDGVILAPADSSSHATLRYLSQRRVPTVLIDRAADARRCLPALDLPRCLTASHHLPGTNYAASQPVAQDATISGVNTPTSCLLDL